MVNELKRNSILIYFSILTLAFALRIYGLDDHGIWHDEKVSISHAIGATYVEDSLIAANITSGDLQQFWRYSHDFFKKVEIITKASGGNALFYDLTLYAWVELFGLSDFSVRFLSVLFSLLSIIMIYKLAELMTNNKNVAFLAAFLLSISHLSIEYSHEARTYAMATFLVLSSTILFYKIFFTQRSSIPLTLIFAYTSINILCFFSHYFTLIALFGQGVFFLVSRPKRKHIGYLTLSYVLFFFLIGAFFLSFGQEGSDSLQQGNQGWSILAKDPANRIDASIKNIFFEYFQVSTHLFGSGLHYLGIRLRYYVIILIVPGIFIIHAFEYAKKNSNLSLIFLPACIFLSHLLIMTINSILSSHTIPFVPKYASLISPILIIPIAVGIYSFYMKFNHNWRASLIILQMILFFLPTYAVYTDTNEKVGNACVREKNPYPKAVREIKMLLLNNPESTLTICTTRMMEVKTLAFYFIEADRLRFELIPDLKEQILIKKGSEELGTISLEYCF